MAEFLDADELRALTGYKPAGKQDCWLSQHRIPHRLDGGRLIVSRWHVTQAQIAAERLEYLRTHLERYILKPDADTIPAGEYPPQGEFSGIYMLFANDAQLLYVGRSVGVGYRNVQHVWAARRGERLPFTQYSAVEVPWELLDGLEVAHIHALTPPENCLPRVSWDRHDEAVKLIQQAWGHKE
jgi:hypothetical protein